LIPIVKVDSCDIMVIYTRVVYLARKITQSFDVNSIICMVYASKNGVIYPYSFFVPRYTHVVVVIAENIVYDNPSMRVPCLLYASVSNARNIQVSKGAVVMPRENFNSNLPT